MKAFCRRISVSLSVGACTVLLTPARAVQIRVASFNVRDGLGPATNAAFLAVHDVLQRLDADIVGLQELLRAEIPAFTNLAATLGYAHTTIGHDQPYRRHVLGWMSRFTLLEVHEVTSPAGADELTRLPLRITVDVPCAKNPVALWNLHHKATPDRTSQFRRAVEAVRLGHDVHAWTNAMTAADFVVLGDMNAWPAESQPHTFTNVPGDLPAYYTLGPDIGFPLAYRVFPQERYAQFGACPVDCLQQDGTNLVTHPITTQRFDYVFVSDSIRDHPAGAPLGEAYNSALDAAGNGLPKCGNPLPQPTSTNASDHLAIFADLHLPDAVLGRPRTVPAHPLDGQPIHVEVAFQKQLAPTGAVLHAACNINGAPAVTHEMAPNSNAFWRTDTALPGLNVGDLLQYHVLATFANTNEPPVCSPTNSLIVDEDATIALWLNEIDYDNPGTDTNEWIELAGSAGLELAPFEIVLVNQNGDEYGAFDLAPADFTFPDEDAGIGFFVIGAVPTELGVAADYTPAAWNANEIQNGPGDAILLRRKLDGKPFHLLDYEGQNPETAEDQCTALADAATTAASLFLAGGPARQCSGFAWTNPPGAASPGSCNPGQTLAQADIDADGLPDPFEQGIADADNNDPIRSVHDVAGPDDYDHDSSCNADEFVAGTDPANSNSLFRIADVRSEPGTNVIVLRWPSAADRSYTVWSATNLCNGFTAIASNLPATPPQNTRTNPVQDSGRFYKITVSY